MHTTPEAAAPDIEERVLRLQTARRQELKLKATNLIPPSTDGISPPTGGRIHWFSDIYLLLACAHTPKVCACSARCEDDCHGLCAVAVESMSTERVNLRRASVCATPLISVPDLEGYCYIERRGMAEVPCSRLLPLPSPVRASPPATPRAKKILSSIASRSRRMVLRSPAATIGCVMAPGDRTEHHRSRSWSWQL